jgi:two-component system, cell cycle response regulator
MKHLERDSTAWVACPNGKHESPRSRRRRTPAAGVAALLRENAELRQTLAAMQPLRELAYRDALTGAWNRRFFEERLAEEFSRARRESGASFTLVIVDLNEMKQINDNHGHDMGDGVLRWTAAFLEQNVRAYDVVFRIGGDEFAVLLPSTGVEDADCLVARLRGQLGAANTWRSVPVGLSFGSATYTDGDADDLAVFRRADKAMYGDKRRQRNVA